MCLEPGSNLAKVARRNLAGFPLVEIVDSPFENWNQVELFDLVVSAMSWHWLDPMIRYRAAAASLRPRGFLAIITGGGAFPKGFDPIFDELQPVYDEIKNSLKSWPPPEPHSIPDQGDDIRSTEDFKLVAVRRYAWPIEYTADQYVDLLGTFSDHIAMEEWQRQRLFTEIRRLVALRPSQTLVAHNHRILNTAQRTA